MSAVTVVDQKARVPRLDRAALDRLAGALDREGVVAAMLIGSQARGSAGPLSDVDVGVWHKLGLDPKALLKLRLELTNAAARALGTDEVDVVLLNGATPLMRHRAIRDAWPVGGARSQGSCSARGPRRARLPRHSAAEG